MPFVPIPTAQGPAPPGQQIPGGSVLLVPVRNGLPSSGGGGGGGGVVYGTEDLITIYSTEDSTGLYIPEP